MKHFVILVLHLRQFVIVRIFVKRATDQYFTEDRVRYCKLLNITHFKITNIYNINLVHNNLPSSRMFYLLIDLMFLSGFLFVCYKIITVHTINYKNSFPHCSNISRFSTEKKCHFCSLHYTIL